MLKTLRDQGRVCEGSLQAKLCLRFVDLSGNSLHDHGCANVIEAAAYSETIEALDISRNNIGEAAVETITMLSTSRLANDGYCFTELHLCENGIGGTAGARLFQCISSSSARSLICGGLSILDLKGNRLQGEAFEKSLLRVVRDSGSLHELDLSGNALR